jgi:hypothetical protein
MPRYFFDVETRDRSIRDETGMDLPDARAVWPEIARLVHDCAGAAPLTPAGRLFDVVVRDEAGHVVERCTTMPGMKARLP